MRRIVLISGWAQPSAALKPLADQLREAYEVDITSVTELHSERCSLAESLVRKLDNRAALVVGWSMGGLVALEAALLAPASVGGIVLLSSSARFLEAQDYAAGSPAQAIRATQLKLRQNPRQALTEFFALMYGHSSGGVRVDAAFGIGAPILESGLRYLEQTDIRAELHRILIPTLVVHGISDRVIRFAAAEYLHTHLPQSRLVALSGGHALPEEQPGTVAREIRLEFDGK